MKMQLCFLAINHFCMSTLYDRPSFLAVSLFLPQDDFRIPFSFSVIIFCALEIDNPSKMLATNCKKYILNKGLLYIKTLTASDDRTLADAAP